MKWYISMSNFLIFFFLFHQSSAQTTPNNISTENNYVIRDSVAYFSESEFSGTFQIIHHTKAREVFAREIYHEIDARRDDEEVVLWKVSAITTIRIFPRNLTFPPSNFRIAPTEIVEIEENVTPDTK